MRQTGGIDHADGDGFAVAHGVVFGCFDGVAHGVAEVQDRAETALALVPAHDLGLDLAGALDDMGKRIRVEREDLFAVLVEVFEESRVPDHAVLDHLGHAGEELFPGEAFEHAEVHQDLFRLVEGADHVLAHGMVHAGLAAHAAVHHGEERGRDLDKGDAAHERGCGETREVADHAAAERDQRRLAVEAVGEERGIDGIGPVEVLVLLAVGDLDGHDQEPGGLEAVQDAVAVELLDRGVRDHGHLPPQTEALHDARRPGPGSCRSRCRSFCLPDQR